MNENQPLTFRFDSRYIKFCKDIQLDSRARQMAIRMACGFYWKHRCLLVRRIGLDGLQRVAEIPN